MKQFDWETFLNRDNKIAVHCKTEEEAKDFCKQMVQHGLYWRSNTSYLDHTNYKVYTSKTCYTNTGTYNHLNYITGLNNYKIFEWSDYMQVIPKDILKPGYMVELRNGHEYIYLPYAKGYSFVRSNYDPVDLKRYDDNLKCIENQCFDVMRIWGYTNLAGDILSLVKEERPLLWERKEHPEIKMTVEEMKQKLEEILNAKIVEE